MALFQIDNEQFAELKSELAALTQSINDLSANVGKWQAQQTIAIQSGLAGLIAAVTGADIEEIQQRIDAVTSDLKQSSTNVEDAIKQDQKG
jgi:phage shock protein A